jgi:hypothetical protein
MHIHSNHMDPNMLNLYAAASAEKAAASKRAAEVRKKLLASASEIKGGLDAEGTLFIDPEKSGQDGRQEQGRERPQPRRTISQNGEEREPKEPISAWA